MATWFRALGPGLLAALPLLAAAGEFSITPVRIFLTPRERAVAVTVSNEGSEPIVMQADLYGWSQTPQGEDVLTPTDDLILAPPILTLAPRSRQVVRLARVGPPPTGEEQTYRLVVREVPEARPAPSMQVQFALAFSIPVFITPPAAKRRLECSVERGGAQTLQAVCSNAGTAYAQPRGFALLDAAGATLAARDSGAYLLPEARRSFPLQAAGPAPAGPATLRVTLDDGSEQQFPAQLAPAQP